MSIYYHKPTDKHQLSSTGEKIVWIPSYIYQDTFDEGNQVTCSHPRDTPILAVRDLVPLHESYPFATW